MVSDEEFTNQIEAIKNRKQLCPIIGKECVKAECTWWISGKCSVVGMAFSLKSIESSNESIQSLLLTGLQLALKPTTEEHKTIHSIVKTDMETGEVIQCSIPHRDEIKI